MTQQGGKPLPIAQHLRQMSDLSFFGQSKNKTAVRYKLLAAPTISHKQLNKANLVPQNLKFLSPSKPFYVSFEQNFKIIIIWARGGGVTTQVPGKEGDLDFALAPLFPPVPTLPHEVS